MGSRASTSPGEASGSATLILEPHSSGHRAAYVRWLVKEALERGSQVIVATSYEADRTSTMQDVENLIGDRARFVTTPPLAPSRPTWLRAVGRIREQLRYYRWFRATHADIKAKVGPVRVVVPYVDYFLEPAGLLGSPFASTPWVGITMRSSSPGVPGLIAMIRLWLLRRLIADPQLRALFSINPSDTAATGDDRRANRRALRPLLDPAELPYMPAKDFARNRLGLPHDATVLLVFGTIDQRKGLRQLLAGIDAADSISNLLVLIVGRQDEQTREQLRTGPFADWCRDGRIMMIDRFVDDEMQGLAFAASDVAWLGYVGHLSMSGVLITAGMSGLPVIGCEEGEIGRAVRRGGFGLTVGVDNPASVAAALKEMLDVDRRLAFGRAARVALAAHTPKRFSCDVLDALGTSA